MLENGCLFAMAVVYILQNLPSSDIHSYSSTQSGEGGRDSPGEHGEVLADSETNNAGGLW